MIIVKLLGGLGNQMFQYAIGRSLAIRNNTDLKLDISLYQTEQEGMEKRKYELNCFALEDCFFASAHDLFWIENRKSKRLLKKIIPIKRWMRVIKEKSPEFDLSILNLPDNVYLDGYWNSEKYFLKVKDSIKKEFVFKGQISSENKELLILITSVESISLHIRRGDYVNDYKTLQHHGLCDIDYYSKAIETIGDKVQSPYFFVFSDDLEWAKTNLKLKYPVVYIDNNRKDDSFWDMYLMCKCKHNIIANSTFSWWGAWLNENPNKIIIAPQKWLNANFNTDDIVPNRWIKI